MGRRSGGGGRCVFQRPLWAWGRSPRLPGHMGPRAQLCRWHSSPPAPREPCPCLIPSGSCEGRPVTFQEASYSSGALGCPPWAPNPLQRPWARGPVWPDAVPAGIRRCGQCSRSPGTFRCWPARAGLHTPGVALLPRRCNSCRCGGPVRPPLGWRCLLGLSAHCQEGLGPAQGHLSVHSLEPGLYACHTKLGLLRLLWAPWQVALGTEPKPVGFRAGCSFWSSRGPRWRVCVQVCLQMALLGLGPAPP